MLKKWVTFILLNIIWISLHSQGSGPDFETLYQRPVPVWFNDAKFGIFVVWGPYSVPSFRTRGYAEWYWKNMENIEKTREFHNAVYSKDYPYEKFAESFKAELFDPDFWVSLFKKSGARYVVTTANYHDGFAMWPTQFAKTINTDVWNSMVTGPKRDILGELNAAGEKYDLRMGIYYSLYEWYHPLWLTERDRYVTEWFHPKFKEVVTKYKPWFIFLDGEWEQDYKAWKSEEVANWLYYESPVKDYVVVNDRWGQCRGIWGDIFESEYGGGRFSSPDHPWQEDRGIGLSYGYNRTESVFDYDSRVELIRLLSHVVGGGGNFLLCVGPTGDGRIPVIMQERLLQIGDWLDVNGEAIYGSTANPFWPRSFQWGTISKKPGKLFIHVHDPEIGKLDIPGININVLSAELLQKDANVPVEFKSGNNSLSLEWNPLLNNDAVTVIGLDVVEGYKADRTPRQHEDGWMEFNCWAMEIHGEKARPHYDGYVDRLRILDWTDPDEYITAEFIMAKPGNYKVELIYSASESTAGGQYLLKVGQYTFSDTIKFTNSSWSPASFYISDLELSEAGKYSMEIKPVDDGKWNGFLLQGIRLSPVKL
jgi:alpha-L-fucosidase